MKATKDEDCKGRMDCNSEAGLVLILSTLRMLSSLPQQEGAIPISSPRKHVTGMLHTNRAIIHD